MANMCFCSTHLTKEDIKGISAGKVAFCPMCKRMHFLKDGKLQSVDGKLVKSPGEA